jgi:hypothetical protein
MHQPNLLTCLFVQLADVLPSLPPSPDIPGMDRDLPSTVFLAVAGTLISLAVLMATTIAFRKQRSTKARIGLGLLVASICLTTVCVTYTAGRHGAYAEAVRNIRRNYSGPAQQPEELEYRGTATFEGSGSHQ